ncbi:hypothetical protein E3N88_23576 [Mikania micrantha]|uniref:Uncharacterized protein n=1 Tax=Mikania micrantha TaxID=192012 RepID=A0A5N6NG77_9ASTR|nr:hypothetical protein E3N88_23576 [Mikania micrantha]
MILTSSRYAIRRKKTLAYVKNGERGRKPCAKRSYGLSRIAKQRKFQRYCVLGLFAVREDDSEVPSRYTKEQKYLMIPNCFAVREEPLNPPSRRPPPFATSSFGGGPGPLRLNQLIHRPPLAGSVDGNPN